MEVLQRVKNQFRLNLFEPFVTPKVFWGKVSYVKYFVWESMTFQQQSSTCSSHLKKQ